jgi:hypothetical protein
MLPGSEKFTRDISTGYAADFFFFSLTGCSLLLYSLQGVDISVTRV